MALDLQPFPAPDYPEHISGFLHLATGRMKQEARAMAPQPMTCEPVVMGYNKQESVHAPLWHSLTWRTPRTTKPPLWPY